MNYAALISEANKIPISSAMSILNMRIPEAGRKTYCPFGELFHRDGGITPTVRIYAHSNTLYCFNCMVSYSPVSLIAKARDCSWPQAASELLDYAGISKRTVQEIWEAATAPVEGSIDISLLGESLKVYCSRISPTWLTMQLESEVSDALNSCFELLSRVRSEEDAELWMRQSKKIMMAEISKLAKTDL